jgi:hypothetical protein
MNPIEYASMELTMIPDFLPPPEARRMAEGAAKALEVDALTASVFREQASGKLEVSKRMMGRLLNLYAAH